jgi:hypothetical protein
MAFLLLSGWCPYFFSANHKFKPTRGGKNKGDLKEHPEN